MSVCYGEDVSRSRARSFVMATIASPRARSPPVTLAGNGTAQSANKECKVMTSASNTVVRPKVVPCRALEMAPDEPEQATYGRAWQFLRANEPGRRLDVHLSYTSFRSLEEQAQVLYGDAKYPRVEYSGTDCRVTIYTIPTALHGRSAAALEDCIRDSVRDILIQHNKRELVKYVQAVGESTYEFTDDQGRPSTKTPDGGIVYCRFARSELVIIIEVGVSEAYLQLKADIELWLNSSQSPNGILLWLSEKPRFSFPSADSRSAYSATQHMLTSSMEQARRDAPFGPYLHSGHSWFGTLEAASLEVYQRDLRTNIITWRKYPLLEGGSVLIRDESIDVGLTISDIFSPDERAVDDIRLEPVRLDTGVLMEVLSAAAKDTAVDRFNAYVMPKVQGPTSELNIV
ncbi:hypothetical protein V1525DRAFT_377924 [Lipomyces kononenkoae]|uniref:Uncharacterized protein n=1 Tax=Lipomyces kononenkoae TaxID=34357 RepID=A0ACC3T0M1_LIPKO